MLYYNGIKKTNLLSKRPQVPAAEVMRGEAGRGGFSTLNNGWCPFFALAAELGVNWKGKD
jgi:hypothetical protein